MPAPLAFLPDDLAPGDQKSAVAGGAGWQCDRIRAVADPLFETAFGALWAEFGEKHEMERRETLALRFSLAPRLLYEMVLVRREGRLMAVRDHTAVLTASGREAVVHLSHNLVMPEARRSGLAGWMRAFPIQTARERLAAAGAPAGAPITLVGEMEYDDAGDPARAVRLQAYEKAGFVKIDPRRVDYHQPDFRAPEEIDANGGARPLPFQLIIRRVGREAERRICGAEVRGLVEALYAVYGPQLRAADRAHPLLDLGRLPGTGDVIDLVPPTQC